MSTAQLVVVRCDRCGHPHEWPPTSPTTTDARARAKTQGWVHARRLGDFPQLDLCPPCAEDLDWEGHADLRCVGTVGSKPWWMSHDQYDPCRCILPPGHDGDHVCEHT